MIESAAQDQLHILYEGNNTTPGATTSDYLSRRSLMNTAIQVWETEEDWKDLYTNLADASDGDKTTDGTTSYDAPTDFLRPVGYLRLGDTDYPYYSPEKYQLVESSDNTTKFFYITGNKSAGFTINIHPAPATGTTIIYEYYKSATLLTATSTAFEMSDPNFAIYFALSKLYEQDGLSGESQKAFLEASSRLEKMKENNMKTPFYQSNKIPDYDWDSRGVSGFGKSRLA
jgi:hypothetical protein